MIKYSRDKFSSIYSCVVSSYIILLEFLEIRELYVVSYVCTNFTRLLLIFLALVLVAEEVPHAQGLVVLDSWEKCTILTRITPSTNTRVKIRKRSSRDRLISVSSYTNYSHRQREGDPHPTACDQGST